VGPPAEPVDEALDNDRELLDVECVIIVGVEDGEGEVALVVGLGPGGDDHGRTELEQVDGGVVLLVVEGIEYGLTLVGRQVHDVFELVLFAVELLLPLLDLELLLLALLLEVE